jgi:hypothetical protein
VNKNLCCKILKLRKELFSFFYVFLFITVR